jgi:hypothetical protein
MCNYGLAHTSESSTFDPSIKKAISHCLPSSSNGKILTCSQTVEIIAFPSLNATEGSVHESASTNRDHRTKHSGHTNSLQVVVAPRGRYAPLMTIATQGLQYAVRTSVEGCLTRY